MRILILALIVIQLMTCKMQASNLSSIYQTFNNLDSKTKTLSVRCFAQDRVGMMWFGTARGLYSYDGYDVRRYTSDTLPSHLLIKCCFIYQQTMLLGGENGFSLFDLQTRTFSKPKLELNEAVSAFCEYKGEIWIGAESGIYIYNLEKETLRPAIIRGKESPRNIRSLAADAENLYIGMMEGVGCYSFSTNSYKELLREGIFFADALLLDQSKQALWIGTARNLIRMNLKTQKFEKVEDFFIVKNIVEVDGDLLIGTDNGLYIYDKQKQWHVISHDAKNDSSLAGNVVSSIFKDVHNNIWIGTDNGISLVAQNNSFISHSLSSITRSNEGNQIFCIHRAATGELWLGGNRGLIELGRAEEGDKSYRWFQMNFPKDFIPHNRIRALYKDSHNKLWVASDRGLLRYNPLTDQFISYIFDNFQNWVYDILEVSDGSLWVATFCGVYCISSEQSPEGGMLQPYYHISHEQGLYSNDVYQLALDSENNLWALTNNHHIDRINLTTKSILPIHEIIEIPHIDAYALMNDSSGNIWISCSDNLLKLSMKNGKITTEKIKLSTLLSTEVFAMEEVENEIWVTTSEGLFMVNKETLNVDRIRVTEKYISIFYDAMIQKVWLGTTNKLTQVDPVSIKLEFQSKEKKITNIVINGNQELDYTIYSHEHIKLNAEQNNLRISFSDFQYTDEKLVNYAYKLENYHSQWMELNSGENSIMLSNLSPGNYELYICPSGQVSTGQIMKPMMRITVLPPWYFSWPAQCFYLLVLIALAWWTVRFIIVRQQLHKEQELRKRLMAQAKSKMNFLTNIAHEFKTPLSLIIAPSGKLLDEEKNKENRALLKLVHENAKKLGSLIHLTLEAYQEKEKIQQSFMPTEIEFVEFARCIFDSYKENMKNGLQDFIFDRNRETIYIRADIFKMESILNNLLSNACKFTPEHGSIMLSLEYDEVTSNLYIKVTDTGVGIPKEEIPFVFQRYYQSTRTAKNDHEGTGVGLSIVKEYVEIHSGSIDITSDENGTTILLTLPIGIECQKNEKRTVGVPMENKEDTRPLIVIVEDNVSTADFINGLLSDDYHCIVAHNGKNGLKLCMNLLPDLIIADVMMPVMDGIEMCHRIREYMPLATVPIILLTAKVDSGVECRSAQLNIDAFIAKPFEYSLLIARIRQLLGNRERLEQQVRIEHIKQPELKGEISADERLLLKITTVIEEHINDSDLTVDALTKLIGISQKQLYRKVKLLTGMSTVEYIRSIRLKKAALLFYSGNFSVAEVMYMVGFSNSSYFTRCFVAEFGKTPVEYLSEKRR